MLCVEEVTAQERRFLKLLEAATAFELSGDVLTLFSGDERLVFVVQLSLADALE
jgi:heat shock protein HslJ